MAWLEVDGFQAFVEPSILSSSSCAEGCPVSSLRWIHAHMAKKDKGEDAYGILNDGRAFSVACSLCDKDHLRQKVKEDCKEIQRSRSAQLPSVVYSQLTAEGKPERSGYTLVS